MPRRALAVSGGSGPATSLCLPELRYCLCFPCTVLLQHGADPNIRNTDGKSALDLADPSAKAVLTGEYTYLFIYLKKEKAESCLCCVVSSFVFSVYY